MKRMGVFCIAAGILVGYFAFVGYERWLEKKDVGGIHGGVEETEQTSEYESETEAETEPPRVYEGDGYSVIYGRTIYFLSEEEREKLREPLVALLSNEQKPVYDDSVHGEMTGFEAEDPDSPSVMTGYACALWDVTADGIPELLIHPWGYYGSGGWITYYAYDIYTGEQVDTIESGMDEDICLYYGLDTRDLCVVKTYSSRNGYGEDSDHTSIYPHGDGNAPDLYMTCGYYLQYDKSAYVWEEYTEVRCSINLKPVERWEYTNILHDFYRDYVRIPETEMVVIDYFDEKNDYNGDRFARAEARADALLSSPQQFVVGMSD